MAESTEKNETCQGQPAQIDEKDFVVDYFRCASRVNALSAVANAKQYKCLDKSIDKRAIFIAQQFLLLNSLEDFAKFINALHCRNEKNVGLLTVLTDQNKYTDFPRILRAFERADEFLEWIGISKKKMAKKIRKQTRTLSLRQSTKVISDSIEIIMSGLDLCRETKTLRQQIYNVTKHGKAIISIKPTLFDSLESAQEEDGPQFFYQRREDSSLSSHIIPFSDSQFSSVTRWIIQINETIKSIIYLFIIQYYSQALPKIQKAQNEFYDLRSELSELFEEGY